MARTKIHPLTLVTDDPLMTLPVTKDQMEALRRAVSMALRYRRLEIQMGVLNDEGEVLHTDEQEALNWWLINVERNGYLTIHEALEAKRLEGKLAETVAASR